MVPDSLGVLGLGELGGAAAWGAVSAGVRRVVGWSPSRADGTQALRVGAVHELVDRADRAVGHAAVVLLARPASEVDHLLRRAAPHLPPDATVLVVSEVHQTTLGHAAAAGLGDRVAALHLMGGDLGAPFASTTAGRWRGQLVYVSGGDGSDRAVREGMGFVEHTLGAEPVLISPRRHDEQVAWTRHLPRAALAVVAHLLAKRGPAGATWDVAAAAPGQAPTADPEGLLDNRAAVAEALGALGAEVEALRRRLEEGDEAGVIDFLQQAARFHPRIR